MGEKLFFVFLVCTVLGISCVECIVGGHRSVSNAAPFMVSVQNPTHICGGALVGTDWVLATASCVQGKSNLKVLVGSDRLLTNMDRVTVSRTNIHTGYNQTSGANNIALLKLDRSVTSSRVKTIALNDVAVTTGLTTEFYGWGSLNYGSSAKSNALQVLYQRAISATDCRAKYQSTLILQNDQFCAHVQPGQAACLYDQGGPLVGYSSKKLIGIYDHGILCSGKYPDAFTSVYNHKTWIETTMAAR
ncbi:trypsin I-P1-like [Armigeres subalbatus]|uniref:trypsin I-P1-like n=1 Tax=Armigeres subalbatus TaxID=124917 RepID=UPI002ED1484A